VGLIAQPSILPRRALATRKAIKHAISLPIIVDIQSDTAAAQVLNSPGCENNTRFFVAAIRCPAFDPADTQRRELERFAGLAGNAGQRPWKYPGLAEAHFRGLVQTRTVDLLRPLTRQIFFGAPTPDQLST
jgi:hypothetical protein